jgi:hypothetical protein
MSWGVGLRNAVGLGLGGIATLFTGYARDQALDNLITESGANLVQEDGSFILV